MESGTRPANSHPRSRRSLPWPTRQSHAEDFFLAWLFDLPDDADVAVEARAEIARLDCAAPLPPGPRRLRELMVAATWPLPVPRRRRARYQVQTVS